MKIRWKVLSIVVFLIRADAEIVNWHAEWSPRSGHALVVFEDKMLLMGGITSNGLVNDVWSSRDGITWSIEATEAEWAPRQDHKVVSFDGNLYLVGGFSTLSTGADVWKSKDGKSWTRILEDAPWGVRAWHECVSFKKKLWLIGGMSASSEEKISGASLSSPTLTNDVWNSSDGIVWTCVSEAVVWSPRFRHACVEYRGQLWLLGGDCEEGSCGDWCTDDGIHWRRLTSESLLPRAGQVAVAYDGRLWQAGGTDDLPKSVVWSYDGCTWYALKSSLMLRGEAAAVVFQGKIWITGGVDDSGPHNDVWVNPGP